MRPSAFALAISFALLCPQGSRAQPSAGAADDSRPPLADDAHVEFSTQAPRPEAPGASPGSTPEGGPGAASNALSPDFVLPPRPRHKGFVLESTAGVLAFAGQFRHVAPPGYWMHAQLGYELTPWLMVLGGGEIALTDTSEAQDPSHLRAFPLWGFGGGARATLHFTERVAGALQAELGALTANVPHDALTYLGFRGAESLGLQAGARLGFEWYQKDPHLALCLELGGRYAQGFSKAPASGDFPLLWDSAAGLRYTF